LARRNEFFLAERLVQIYEGDTALHAAAFSYDSEMVRLLLIHGADMSAKNRRGAETLHAAVIGVPGSPTWNPPAQSDVIVFLVESGADPNAVVAGAVTPLHRAVRNRCSAAVEVLLRVGANPDLPNGHGTTASDLATMTTGRGGSGSAEAKAEQRIILELFRTSHPRGDSRPSVLSSALQRRTSDREIKIGVGIRLVLHGVVPPLGLVGPKAAVLHD
jgi:hypothetical protein